MHSDNTFYLTQYFKLPTISWIILLHLEVSATNLFLNFTINSPLVYIHEIIYS